MESTIGFLKKVFQALADYFKGIGFWRYLLYVLLSLVGAGVAMGLVYLDIMLFHWGKPVLAALSILVTVIYLVVIPVMAWRRKSKKTA